MVTFTLKVVNDNIALPQDVHLPNGTTVVVSVPSDDEVEQSMRTPGQGGLKSGIDLDDMSAVYDMLDAEEWKRKHG